MYSWCIYMRVGMLSGIMQESKKSGKVTLWDSALKRVLTQKGALIKLVFFQMTKFGVLEDTKMGNI